MITLRRKTIRERIKINNEVFEVEIDTEIPQKAVEKFCAMSEKAETSADGEEAAEIRSKALCEFVYTLFGEAGGKILAFYSYDYGRIANSLLPFLRKKILPQVRKLNRRMEKSALKKYGSR